MKESNTRPFAGARHGRHGRLLSRMTVCTFLIAAVLLSGGCTRLLTSHYSDTLPQTEGRLSIKGLHSRVTIRRDEMSIPFIEASDMQDLAMAIGYVNASDRLTQMIGTKLLSQGRLSEMAGEPALDIDIFMRTVSITKAARILYEGLSPENKVFLDRYAEGVNAYIEQYRDKLPPELAMSGYTPGKWEPLDSMSILALVNFALSFNLHEEAEALVLAQAVGHEKAAWLMPVHPDEPLPMGEGNKLSGINLKGTLAGLKKVAAAGETLASLGFTGIAASNNWAISKDLTERKASIFANDTHLQLMLPSLWNMMHIRCKGIDAAGVCAAGLPGIVAGYNGHIAWGMTMVMADNQDLFLEKLKVQDGELSYLHKGSWLPVTRREETFHIRGHEPVRITVRETIHGPLLNDAVKLPPKNLFMPNPVELPYGIALSWAAFEPEDKSLDAFFSLLAATSVDEAVPILKRIRVMALNMVVADRENIAWQVTGRYPVRKSGRGLVPSPGWTGEYDWDGFLDVDKYPSSLNPPEGYIATANNKTVSAGYPHILSSSWYWPDRINRIVEMIQATRGHTAQTSRDIQLDTHTSSLPGIRKVLLEGDSSRAIASEIAAWQDESMKENAREALAMFREFDGDLNVLSRNAVIMGAFMNALTGEIFLDELGPSGSPAWKAFISSNSMSYNATSDHLIVRGDESPFWDDAKTPARETKALIIARSLAKSIVLIEESLGKDRTAWTWGKLHTYGFVTESSRMAPHLEFAQRAGLSLLSSYFNRGPFPAPGDFTTPNISAYMIGRDFDTWLIPAMRLVVDFSLEEPVFIINSTGQSDNPSSPHYDDGIHAWLEGRYRGFPFANAAIEKQYGKVLLLEPE